MSGLAILSLVEIQRNCGGKEGGKEEEKRDSLNFVIYLRS
jgi:hypothetical protein